MGRRTLFIGLALVVALVLLLAWLDGGQTQPRPIQQPVDLGPGVPA